MNGGSEVYDGISWKKIKGFNIFFAPGEVTILKTLF